MSNSNIIVHISIPKAIGDSKTITLEKNSTVFDAINKLNQSKLLEKVMKNDTEFSQFVLIYLNEQRIKDSSLLLVGNSNIEIIIPMAGG